MDSLGISLGQALNYVRVWLVRFLWFALVGWAGLVWLVGLVWFDWLGWFGLVGLVWFGLA